jgi:hypothetical protein
MDFDKLFPGRFLKAADLNGKDVTLTISAVVVDELIGDKGTEVKGLISFAGKKKQLVLNKTNGLCFKQMFGRETDAWVGKRITIYPTTFNDEPCIRVKGSPDIEADINFELKLPRKAPRATKLVKTTPASAPAAAVVDAEVA